MGCADQVPVLQGGCSAPAWQALLSVTRLPSWHSHPHSCLRAMRGRLAELQSDDLAPVLRTYTRGFRWALGCHRLCTRAAGPIAHWPRMSLPATQTTINCTLTIEEVSERECRQTLEGDVHIGVMGLGSIAERIICSSLRDVYSGIPEIANRRAKYEFTCVRYVPALRPGRLAALLSSTRCEQPPDQPTGAASSRAACCRGGTRC